MAARTKIRIGTRSSPLAMAQAHMVVAALASAHPDVETELVPMTTRGDRDARAFSEIGERGIFATELERALAADEIDAAVHSSKDLALGPDGERELAAFLPREDPRDVLCGPMRALDELPHGAVIATSSSRRVAALAHLRSDLVAEPIRGNVQTRLARSAERGDAGCMLAAAGLRRLGLEQHVGFAFDVSQVVPEAGQGAVVVQVRRGEVEGPVDWRALDHEPTSWAVGIEREVAFRLGGGCGTPVGVHVSEAAAWWFVADGAGGAASGSVAVARTDSELEVADALVRDAQAALATFRVAP